jgi:RNA polymerase sigma-70 factor (ECF subfamily)
MAEEKPASSSAGPAGPASFPTTHWSLIVHAGAGDAAQVHAALETLCRRYWFPLYAFARRQGRSHHEAEDCTQEFLARLLAADGVARARPERGRFRTFLLTALRNFLIKDWQRAQALKRGGGGVLPLDFDHAEQGFGQQPADPALTPEHAFDRTWALGMITAALDAIRADYGKSGRSAQFAALAPFVWGDGAAETLAAPAARLGMTTHAFTVALHRLRQRVGQRLRADVAQTVASDAEVDDELRHLIAAVSATPPAIHR